MTLNQILKRLETIITAHKQVRSYNLEGISQEFKNEHTALYPSVSALIQPGNVGIATKQTSYGFVIDFEDLVNVSSDTKSNEWDVVSDMASIAEDILAELNNPNYDDWKISDSNPLQPFFDNDNDRTAGVRLTITISKIYSGNICEVPTNEILIIENDTNVKLYDLEYIATGTEGTTLAIPTILGKKVLAPVIREGAPLHKVSNNPDPAEFTWNDTSIGLGTPVNQGERFLILYRNY